MILKELNLTEGRGTGIPTIKRVCQENGSADPKFDADEPERRHFITEILIHPDFADKKELDKKMGDPISTPIGTPIESLTNRQKEIINLISKDNKLSRRVIADKLNINESAVKKHLNILKVKGALIRIGGTRGYWQVKN